MKILPPDFALPHALAGVMAVFILCLSACANTDHFEAAAVSDPDKALVYIYRPAASNPGKKPLTTSYPEILVDGESAGFLRYKEHIAVELEPGTREFVATGLTANARWEPKDVQYKLRLESGKTYYLRMRVEFNTDKMTIGSFRGQYLINLHPVDNTEALYEIRHTDESG